MWSGAAHAAVNATLAQVITAAWPEQALRICAAPDKIAVIQDELRAAGDLPPRLGFCPVRVSSRYPGKTHLVSARRLLREAAAVWRALGLAPRGEPCLVVLASATATLITAAIIAAAASRLLHRRRVGIQAVLHGNLNEIDGWRSRNPLRRAFDLRSVLARPHCALRYLVLEEVIRAELLRRGAAAAVDALPHPVSLAGLTDRPPLPLAGPLRFGLVGQATEAKGSTVFLAIARRLRARHGSAVEFHLVGPVPPGGDLTRFAALSHPVEPGLLSRETYLQRLAALHFVLLPLRPEYYRLSASGGLLDAIVWCKPLIATRLPVTEALFAQQGDLGVLCDDDAGLEAAVDAVLRARDAARYARQVEALRRLRDSRRPDRLAPRYRALTEAGFPGLLALERDRFKWGRPEA
jgi:hypothetical protein